MLTPEQLAERRKGIGGSDAAKIVSGDWYALWLDKTGRAEPEDLSGNFAVQLGIVTEKLNLDWYERTEGTLVIRRGEVLISAAYPFMRCTLDGWDKMRGMIIQAKHVNGFSKIEDVVSRYTPQVTHEMIVGQAMGLLSVIIGTNEPVKVPIPMDEFFAAKYIDQCRAFWQHVIDDTPPAQGAPIEVPKVPPKLLRKVEMAGNNEWALYAGNWLEHAGAAKKFKAAETGLKALVEDDVGEASGYGVMVARDGRGLKIKKVEK